MAKSAKRGGAKAHRRRVKNRNNKIAGLRKKTEKMFNDAMMEQLEKMRESFSGMTEDQEQEPVETSESVQLNLAAPSVDPHL
jgi:hypothetical protein